MKKTIGGTTSCEMSRTLPNHPSMTKATISMAKKKQDLDERGPYLLGVWWPVADFR